MPAKLASVGRWGARAIDRLILEPEDPTALGLCRVVLVSILTLSLLAHVGAVADYFSADSVLAGPYAREAFPSRWSLFFWITDPWAVRVVFACGVVAHLLWLVGLFTTPAAVVAWTVWASMLGRHPLLYSLPDELQMALCTLLALMPAGRGLSLDAKWRGKRRSVPVWCRRMIQLQLAVMYLTTGLLKDGHTWREEGSALYYSLANPYNRHFAITPTLAQIQPWLLRPATWATLVFEVGFAPFLALHWLRELSPPRFRIPDFRGVVLGVGVAMHLGIQAMLYVAWFSPMAIAAYSAFLTPAEAKRWLGRLRRRS